MACYREVCERWVRNCLDGHTRTHLQGANVLTGAKWSRRNRDEWDRIYSYGQHFEMARLLRDRKGRPLLFLINGDTFSVTTSRHQGYMRAAVERSGLRHVIVPYTVLDSAGLEPESVKVIDVLEDRWITNTRSYTTTPPDTWQWRLDEITEWREFTEAERAKILDEEHAHKVASWQQNVERTWRRIEADGLFTWALGYGRPSLDPPKRPKWEGRWRNEGSWHVVGAEWNLYVSRSRYAQRAEVTTAEDGTVTYSHTTQRHVLGEAVIEGRIAYVVRQRCTECGGFGRRPGPRSRYGPGTSMCFRCSGRRVVTITRHRTARFLSGFDANEPRLSYFFCELPTRKSRTVAEAYEELRPDVVRMAEQMGRTVARQGDIFAVPMPGLTKRDLTRRGAVHQRRGVLLGTNHVATDVAVVDGQTFARGLLTHAPQFRDPDHVRVRLEPKVWHLIVKNTVPIAK